MSALFTAIATAAIMVGLSPATAVNPVFGLGHYNEGEDDLASQEYDRFEDCLTDHEHESSEVTEEQIEHCVDVAYHGGGNEISREENDDDSDEDRANMQSEDEDEDGNDLEDSAFFGDDSEDSDVSSNDFNSDHDSADDESSSTDY